MMEDICELAHTFTVRECEQRRIIVDAVQDNEDIHYTEEAQEIFNYYYSTLEELLGV